MESCEFGDIDRVPAFQGAALSCDLSGFYGGFNSVPLKVADVASVADEERRNESFRISRGEPVLKSNRNPHKLGLGAGIDTFCRNGPSIVGAFLLFLLCRLT